MKTSDPAPDLNKAFPRSPRETLAGFVIAARTLDKCRATLAGTNGEYKFDCSLDRVFFDFSGMKADEFREFVATGATDEAVADWIKNKAREMDDSERIAWNNQLRGMRLADMPADRQVFLEDYISKNLPAFPPVYVWFDVYDIEEKRLR